MKTVLITGANRGIGLEHTRSFMARGVHVYAAVRAPSEASELFALAGQYPGLLTVLPYDATQAEAAASLKADLADTPIDLLFANAGLMGTAQSFGSVDVEQVLQLVQVNALAPLMLAQALVDNVARSGRKLLALQSSQMGSIADNSSGGYYGYRISKAALNMVARNLSRDLQARGLIVVSLHPGWVKTRMGGQSAPLTVAQCVAGQQRLFDQLTAQDSGRFFNYDGKELPW